jgi:hypothetical protein
MTLDQQNDRILAFTYSTRNTPEECLRAASYIASETVPECEDCDNRSCAVCASHKREAYELLDMLGLTGDKELETNVRPSKRRAVRHMRDGILNGRGLGQ